MSQIGSGARRGGERVRAEYGRGGDTETGSVRESARSAKALRQMVLIFFFFQAEDGIRDLTVTGVQTCALPISTLPCATLRSAPIFRSAIFFSSKISTERPAALAMASAFCARILGVSLFDGS